MSQAWAACQALPPPHTPDHHTPTTLFHGTRCRAVTEISCTWIKPPGTWEEGLRKRVSGTQEAGGHRGDPGDSHQGQSAWMVGQELNR